MLVINPIIRYFCTKLQIPCNMREFLGIILTVVLTIVASAVDDRLKKRKRRKLAAAYQRDFADDEETVNDTVGLPPLPPAIPVGKPVLPEEGVRVTRHEPIQVQNAPEVPARDEAALRRKHFAAWRKAVIASELLGRKNV